MKKWFVLLFLLCSTPCWADGLVIGWPATGGGSACTQRFSDDFSGTLASWTIKDGTFAIVSGELQHQFSTGYASGTALRGETSTVTQYARLKISTTTNCQTASQNIGLQFRTDVNYTSGYSVNMSCSDGDIVWWDNTTDNVTTADFVEGDVLGVVVKGTGTNTVISIFKNPTNLVPLSGGTACTDTGKPCWDAAGDAPDYQATTDPTSPCDTNKYVGITSWGGSNSLGSPQVVDDFYAGDCSD